MPLQDARIFGGIGSIIQLIAILSIVVNMFLPNLFFIWPVISIVGWIFIIIAVRKISKETKEQPIFTHYLIYVIMSIVGPVAVILLFVRTVGFQFFMIFSQIFSQILRGDIIGIREGLSSLPGALTSTTFILPIILLAVYAIEVVAAVFLKKSFSDITKRTGVESFKTSAILYLIGIILLIIPIIGVFLGGIFSFISSILLIISFFSLPDTLPEPPKSEKSEMQSLTAIEKERKVCLNCGRIISVEYNHCPYCGAKVKKEEK